MTGGTEWKEAWTSKQLGKQHSTGHALRNISIQVVIIQPVDTGSKTHAFPHALVAGIERYPQQITKRMSKARQAKRSKVNHLMPTRYTLELEGLKNAVTNDTFKEVSQREDAKKVVKKALDERYQSGKNRWFFTPLSMLKWIGSAKTISLTRMTGF
jgi:large subunit ribosomal protein L27e